MTNEEAIKDIKEHVKLDGNGRIVLVGEISPITIDMAINALEERPKGKWIPVSERLPEESGYYLVNVFIEDCYFSEVCVRWFAHPDDYFIKTGEWRECAEGELVTAWMPLLEPYKAEMEGEE